MENSQGHYPNDSRYKSMQSEEDTRNPTTSKKVHGTPIQFRRSQPYPYPNARPSRLATHSLSIEEELQLLEAKKLQYMRLGKFKKAEKMHEAMSRTRSLMSRKTMERVSSVHWQEKRSITVAHKQEMHYLNRLWSDYFGRLREREEAIVESFKLNQQLELRQAHERVEQRRRSLRSTSREILDLQRREEYLFKTNNFRELSHVRRRLKDAARKEQEQQHRLIEHWARVEEQRLSTSHAKKYNTLISRLSEYRQNKERVYMREQKRLKKKYKNVLAQLHHEQALELYHTSRQLSFDSDSLF